MKQQQKRGKVLFPFGTINEDTHCTVCLDIIKETMMGPCCHRLCRECYNKVIRLNNKECPQCRAPVNNRRVLREDGRFDNLLREIYGEVSAFDVLEEKLPKLPPPTRPRPRPKVMEKSHHHAISSTFCCEVVCHPESREIMCLPKKYVWTVPHMPVSSFQKMIQNEYRRRGVNDAVLTVEICAFVEEKEIVLDAKDTVEELLKRFNRGKRMGDLLLMYKITGK